MKDWWENLQSRERYMLLVTAVLVSIAILYFAIWSPAISSRDTKQKRVDAKRDTIIWMSQKKQELEHLKRINPNMFNQASDGRSLLAIVDTGTKQMGIRSAVTRIEPKGEDSVHLYLEDMAFDYLVVLLDELERRNNIEVTDVSFNRSNQIGKITGKITLTR